MATKITLQKTLTFTCLRSGLTDKCVAEANTKFGKNTTVKLDYETIQITIDENQTSILEVREFFTNFYCAFMGAKKLNATVKQIMVTNEFGNPMYLKEAVSLMARPTLTENKSDAMIWGLLDQSKLSYNAILVGAKELKFEKIN